MPVRRTLLLSGIVSFVMALIATIGAMVVLQPSNAGAQLASLRASQLSIAGDSGADRILLEASPGPDEGALKLLDANGMSRVAMEMGGPKGDDPNAYGFHLRAADGTIVGNLGTARNAAGEDTGITLTLNDQSGHSRVRILVADDGTPSISLLDADGNVTWSAP
jgi:hypothetical protein